MAGLAAAELVDLGLHPDLGVELFGEQLVLGGGGDDKAITDLAVKAMQSASDMPLAWVNAPPGQGRAELHEGVRVVDEFGSGASDDRMKHVVAVAGGGVRALEGYSVSIGTSAPQVTQR